MSTETASLETYIQVGPDSTGKKVRNLLVGVPAVDGSTSLAYMQVVALADQDGFPLPAYPQELFDLLRDLKESIDLLREELT